MSATPPPTPGPHRDAGPVDKLWHRLSEGKDVGDLWSQFSADARASYGFYGKEIDWEQVKGLAWYRRPFHVAGHLFWALLTKLSPARRVLLVLAVVMLFTSTVKVRISENASFDFNMNLVAAVVFLLLLSLELADKVTMKRDLEIAREIQLWLVPAKPPEVSGADIAFATRPQNSVAGDYYDAFYPIPGSQAKLLLVIADVAGKSVPAALLMATFQASLRTVAGEDAPLADIVKRVNRYACAHSLDGMRFTTAVLAEYDPVFRRLTYVNAGHNAPVLRRKNGLTEELDSGGVPFGIDPEAAYQSATIELVSGDTLIFFTDGVVEAFNQEGQEFGNARWIEAIRAIPEVSADRTLRLLFERVDEFVGATRQFDDITCMVFRST